MAITLRQVALRSGLSVQTVSGVLGNRGHLFRPETCQRVLKAAKALEYRPNTFAKAIRGGRFGGISLLLSTDKDRSHIPAGMMDGMHSVLSEKDLHLNVAWLPDEKLTNSGFVPKILRQLMTDGLLIDYTDHIPAKMVELIEQHAIPSIWLNTRREESVVRPDDLSAARQATRCLLEAGHRRIAYADYHNNHAAPDPHYSVADRYQGYTEVMTEAGLPTRAIWEHRPIHPDERIHLAAQWLRRPDRPTAVVCYSDWTAVPLLLSATTLCGLRVPDDLSLITFSDQVRQDIGITIAAMILPEVEIGRTAVELLLQKIESPGLCPDPVAIPFHLELGVTAAAPPVID